MANSLQLEQQEADLEAQIETYRSQLRLVKESAGGGGLGQLLEDLQQLIELSEQNLLEIKRHKLLLMLDPNQQGAGLEAKGGGEAAGSTLHPATAVEGQDDVVGTKCRAPLKESWGGENYHNAVILCLEPSNPQVGGCNIEPLSPPAADDPLVRLLFTQPMYAAMKPCPFFLEGTCKFSELECKFSHGHVVPLSRLRPYAEPDHSIAHVGGKCVAKHEDGIWYPAIISSLGPEYVVHFPSLTLTSTVDQEGVIPLESDDDSSSASEDSEGGSGQEEEGAVVVEWRPSGLDHALGEWERHTTGIGSKLLAKMGYILGRGLGKEGQGRVEPVEITILPAGKSLDVCAELREAKKVRTVDGVQVKKRKKKGKKKGTAAEESEKKHTDMFEFLNTEVFSRRSSSQDKALELRKASAPSSADSGNLNVKLFKVQEQIKAVQKRKKSLRESLQRHQKRKDKQLVEQVKKKLWSVEAELQHLHHQEMSVERNISSKSERKKLSMF